MQCFGADMAEVVVWVGLGGGVLVHDVGVDSAVPDTFDRCLE